MSIELNAAYFMLRTLLQLNQCAARKFSTVSASFLFIIFLVCRFYDPTFIADMFKWDGSDHRSKFGSIYCNTNNFMGNLFHELNYVNEKTGNKQNGSRQNDWNGIIHLIINIINSCEFLFRAN